MAYATEADLTEYLDGDPMPSHPQRLLNQASDDIDELLIGAVYPVDADGVPTGADHIDALMQVCVLQALFLAPDPDGRKRQYSSMSTSNVSWTRATDASGSPITPEFSARAYKMLRLAGLMNFVTVGRG